jgi:hypothetical protein
MSKASVPRASHPATSSTPQPIRQLRVVPKACKETLPKQEPYSMQPADRQSGDPTAPGLGKLRAA